MEPERRQRVTDLFHAALALDPARRAEFLAEACAEDTAVRDEVASLLAAHGAAGSFLQSPAVAVGAEMPLDPSPGSDAERLDGRRVGPYVVRREIGRGGMGVVYLAEDTRLNRLVAIKMLPAGWARDAARRDRLMQEARAAAALSHPGIATVYALEEIEDLLFIVAEYVRGPSLRDELAHGPLPAGLLVETAVEIAQALAAAHARGVVHRDLKPENVLRAESGRVKILDFGLARTVTAEPAQGPRLTAPGVVFGTPAYMSPEQIDGREVDFRSDLYSFGVMLYELGTGSLPDLGTSAPLPHPGLDRIARRCLRQRPEDRYASTLDFVADLERVRDRPLDGRPDSRGAGRYWWRVHQLWVSAAYLGLLYPAWLVKEWQPGWLTLSAFLALVAAGATGCTLRWHLLFTERVDAERLAALTRRSARPLRSVDYGFSALLLVLGASVVRVKPTLAALLLSAATALSLASAVIEPATTRAALRRRQTNPSRGPTPPGPAGPPA